MTTSAKLWFLLICVVPLNWIEGDHFNGGTITYKVLKTYDSIVSISLTHIYFYAYNEVNCNDTMIAEKLPLLYYNESWGIDETGLFHDESVGDTNVPIGLYCTDYSETLDITVGQKIDVINFTHGSHFLIADKGEYWRSLSLSLLDWNWIHKWSVAYLINSQIRSNGQYNHPPVVTMISPIYITVNILQVILIPTIDVDHDEVRCRFAKGSDECGDACYPESLPEGTKLLPNCTLFITGLNIDDWYAVAIMIEDFIDSTSTDPLSSIPVQFLINVQDNTTTCPSPRLTSSSVNESGQCIGVLVGQPHIIELIAEHDCSDSATIEDIATLSFPNVIKTPFVQNSTFLWSVSLRWTPTLEQVGLQVLCAVAIDSNYVQSNQYCIIFTVAEDNISSYSGQTIMPNIKSDSNIKQTTVITSLTSFVQKSTVSVSNSTNSTINSYQISSMSYHKNISTDSIVVSPASNSTWLWRWGIPVIAILSGCSIAFWIWCCCCYPPCRYFARRRKRLLTNKIIQQNNIIRPPNHSSSVVQVFKSDQNLNINNIHKAHSSNDHISRIKSTSSPFNNVGLHTLTSVTQVYIFGSRNALKNQQAMTIKS